LFLGKDGSRAFITGEFNDAGLIDDVSGLTPKDLKALQDWIKFYRKDYKYVGKFHINCSHFFLFNSDEHYISRDA
jgi:hypothetical protein